MHLNRPPFLSRCNHHLGIRSFNCRSCAIMDLLSVKRRQLQNREPVWVNNSQSTSELVVNKTSL